MLSSKTGFVLSCIFLLSNEFSFLSDCASNAPPPPRSINARRTSFFSLSPRSVNKNLSPIPSRPADLKESDKKPPIGTPLEDRFIDSEMIFPFSFSFRNDSKIPTEFCAGITHQDTLPVIKRKEQDENKRLPTKRYSPYKPDDSFKFKSIEMTSPLAFSRITPTLSPVTSNASNASCSPHPATVNSPLPVIEGKRVVKKEKEYSEDFDGGFPGWEYSAGEESEYEYVDEESDFDSDSDEEITLPDGTRIYKPVENPSTDTINRQKGKGFFAFSDDCNYIQFPHDCSSDENEDFDQNFGSILADMKGAKLMEEED